METKKFRKIYWVTEQVNAIGQSAVTGVYTSIPDLVDHGLHLCDGVAHRDAFRLSLVELDRCGALGAWTSPGFDGVKEDLMAFVATAELVEQDVESLAGALEAHPLAGAPSKA